MVNIIQTSQLTLHEVKTRFNLSQAREPDFFTEWQEPVPQLSDHERYWLDQARENFLSLVDYRLHEEVVKISILAPVLAVSGLCRAPFVPTAEKPLELTFEVDDQTIRGRLDLVVVYQNLWVATIETKPQQVDVLEALPQLLTYMMLSPVQTLPLFGLLTNGRHFMFVKLVKSPSPTFALSDLLTLFRQQNELYPVVAILQTLRDKVLAQGEGLEIAS